MVELYQIEDLLECFEEKINTKFQHLIENFEERINIRLEKLKNQMEIITKKIKDYNIKEFNDLISYEYQGKIFLHHCIREKLTNCNIEIYDYNIEKQIIFLHGKMSEHEFLSKNIIPERFIQYN